MWFCPVDGTLLLIANASEKNCFICSTCNYLHTIAVTRSVKKEGVRKKMDDILGGSAAWENVDRTQAVCPACNHDTAYFMQMQIRSADEPMSIFYKCVQCSHQWNDK